MVTCNIKKLSQHIYYIETNFKRRYYTTISSQVIMRTCYQKNCKCNNNWLFISLKVRKYARRAWTNLTSLFLIDTSCLLKYLGKNSSAELSQIPSCFPFKLLFICILSLFKATSWWAQHSLSNCTMQECQKVIIRELPYLKIKYLNVFPTALLYIKIWLWYNYLWIMNYCNIHNFA